MIDVTRNLLAFEFETHQLWAMECVHRAQQGPDTKSIALSFGSEKTEEKLRHPGRGRASTEAGRGVARRGTFTG